MPRARELPLDPSANGDHSSPQHAQAWALRLGVTVEELRLVVAQVGVRPAAVGTAFGVPLKASPLVN